MQRIVMRARMTQIQEKLDSSLRVSFRVGRGLAKSNKHERRMASELHHPARPCHARAHDPNTQKKSLIPPDASRGGQMKSCKLGHALLFNLQAKPWQLVIMSVICTIDSIDL